MVYSFSSGDVKAAVTTNISGWAYRSCHAERCLRPLPPGTILDRVPAKASMGQLGLRFDDSFVPKIAPMSAVEAC
jgi:hypothetical protein